MKQRSVRVSMCAVSVILLSSCTTHPEKDRLADDFARLCFPYDDFMNLYKDLRVRGKPAGRDTYEKYIQVVTDELCDRFSAEELQEAISFYESPLGQKLFKHGRESKANMVLGTPPGIWTCPEHKQTKRASEGECPTCKRELVWVETTEESP